MAYTLRQMRTLRNLTQQDMAEKLHIHPNTYKAYEICPAKVKIITLLEIMDILECGITDLKLFTSSDKVFYDLFAGKGGIA